MSNWSTSTYSAGLIDRAETFEESNLTVSTTAAEAGSGTVRMALGETGSATISDHTNSSSTDISGWCGQIFKPTQDLQGIEFTLDAPFGEPSRAQLYRPGDSTVLDEVTGLSQGDTVRLVGEMTDGTTYQVRLDAEGSEYTVFQYTNSDYNELDHDGVNVTGSIYGGSAPENIRSMTGLEDATSASAVLEWTQPEDIYRWDSVLFQATEDGETVTVDVQESTDGGDTWDTIATDVNRGQEITADPSSEVRLRVHLSRDDTANNPTLDAVYRRYIV